MASVEARFAGGRLLVTATVLPATGIKMVSFRAPAAEFPLYPDEARSLAVKLIEFAAKAEAEEDPEWP